MSELVEEELAEFVSSVSWSDIPVTTQGHLLDLMSDALVVASAGHAAPGMHGILSSLAGPKRPASACVWFEDVWADGPTAALLNATLLQAWDYDDVHDDGLVHAMCLMLPTVLAAAQTHESHGDTLEFLTSVAVGIEVLCRLGKAVQPLDGWTATSTLGGICLLYTSDAADE